MKFYYNGTLMRTSKTHEYHFAILGEDDKLWSCHSTLEAAQKEFRRPIAERESSIEDCRKAIEAIENGRLYFDTKVCRRWYRVSLKGKNLDGKLRSDANTWREDIEMYRSSIEKLTKTRRIVELEMRA